jgi:hypothetical protein
MKKETFFSFFESIGKCAASIHGYEFAMYVDTVGFVKTDGYRLCIWKGERYISEEIKESVKNTGKTINNHKFVWLYVVPKNKSLHGIDEFIVNNDCDFQGLPYQRVIPKIDDTWKTINYDKSEAMGMLWYICANTGLGIDPECIKLPDCTDCTMSVCTGNKPVVFHGRDFLYFVQPIYKFEAKEVLTPDITEYYK